MNAGRALPTGKAAEALEILASIEEEEDEEAPRYVM